MIPYKYTHFKFDNYHADNEIIVINNKVKQLPQT